MKTWKLIVVELLAFTTWTGCQQQPALNGAWARQITDDDLGAQGTEVLAFTSDSTFELRTDMKLLAQSDSFRCELKYGVVVGGDWYQKDGALTLHARLERFSFQADSASFVADFTRADESVDLRSIQQHLYHDLCQFLSDYYFEFYASQPDNNLIIDRIQRDANQLSGFCDEDGIVYKESPSSTNR